MSGKLRKLDLGEFLTTSFVPGFRHPKLAVIVREIPLISGKIP